MKRALLAIDLQCDFCNTDGALYVNGADSDVKNVANLIKKNIHTIDTIILSMDSHQPVHIAHQIYWKNTKGAHPKLFETITSEDLRSNKWIAQYNKNKALDYLQKLEEKGSACTIWPPHCIIGTKGWTLNEEVYEAVEKWTIDTGHAYTLINKGMYQATEHYSIFRAAVEYPAIEQTMFNTELISELKKYDEILIVGEATDFCIANSLKDILDYEPSLSSKLYMLEDCMSYIVPNNLETSKIFDRAKHMGVTFCLSTGIKP